MKSNNKVIKALNKKIANQYCCIVDYELDECPSPDKLKAIDSMKETYQELIQIRDRLKEILID